MQICGTNSLCNIQDQNIIIEIIILLSYSDRAGKQENKHSITEWWFLMSTRQIRLVECVRVRNPIYGVERIAIKRDVQVQLT